VVHHSLHSAPQLPPRHRFPMPVFQVIHDALIADGVVHPRQVRHCMPGWSLYAMLVTVCQAGHCMLGWSL